MRMLIFGGTQFLGRAIADHAVAAGHDVTCAARGTSGPVPSGVRFVHVDRDEPAGLAPLAGETFDAVVDLARHPIHVRHAVAALRKRAGHWTFVSTVSVYADNRTVGQRAETAPVRSPTAMDVAFSTEETYGAAKVACEQMVGENAFICRAGLIVGPGDPTGRFTYWPARLQRGGEVLVAGTPDDAVQLIDVRDLATWIVFAAESRLTGIYDGIGPPVPKGAFLADCAKAVDGDCAYVWVDRAFMESQGIKPWSGPRSLPMWLPMPDFAGFETRDTSPARQSGLVVRSLAETARDTFLWSSHADGHITGFTSDEERDAIKAWRAGQNQN
jgi:2'-hydroxyisoflavone reductase